MGCRVVTLLCLHLHHECIRLYSVYRDFWLRIENNGHSREFALVFRLRGAETVVESLALLGRADEKESISTALSCLRLIFRRQMSPGRRTLGRCQVEGLYLLTMTERG